MSDAKSEQPQKPDRMAEFLAAVARRAVLVGVVVGGLVGLGLGAMVLNIIGCRRDANRAREEQKVLRDWDAEQARKQQEERRWRVP